MTAATIATNLHGRLRNTSLPYSNGLLPVFEAVANAIHAIEDAGLPMAQGQIVVEIERVGQARIDFQSGQKKRGPESKDAIKSFTITDNGVGFTDENMDSFRTLDSEYKAARGGRGVGRLLWLKAFKRTSIKSTYIDPDGGYKYREFLFRSGDGITEKKPTLSSNKRRSTVVLLEGFSDRYREASPKTAQAIANRLLEHCLWFFIRPGGAPRIIVIDEDERISLDDVYETQMVAAATTETIHLKNVRFDLIHMKLSAASGRSHSIAFCAANRLVIEESLKGKIPGLYGSLKDDNGSFVYECYVSSPWLDERVRSERTSFDIQEEPTKLFAATELSQKEIREAIIAKSSEFLAEYLEEKKKLGQERVNLFVAQRAPRYRPILARIPEDQLDIDPETSDKELDLILHKHLAEIENQMIAEGHDVMVPKEEESYDEYRSRLDAYLKKADDIKRSDLANYVSHRKVIIDLMQMAIRRKDDGTYVREDLIHNLIMPMRKDSSDVPHDSCNLWLIDERLAFHDYLASDKPLSTMPITGAASAKEPDIVALNVFDNPVLVSEGSRLPPASLVVVEIKRPMRNDAAQVEEKDPIEQALGYLERIRLGKVTTAEGRPIPNSDNIPGFCYVLCDLTDTIERRCRMHDAVRTRDGLGYFFYHKEFKAYVEVISFDGLVNAAKERNRAFFDKLGLPTT
jgi:hypothetical protein